MQPSSRPPSPGVVVWTEAQRQLRIVLLTRSCAEVGTRCKVTAASVSALATGKRREPHVKLALRLDRFFGVRIAGWDVEPQS